MTEVKGQCPSHKGNTKGSDSYYWNIEKQQGLCRSCGLVTWQHNDNLYGKRPPLNKPFKIDGGQELPIVGHKNDFESKEPLNTNVVTYNEEGRYTPLRGISKETMEFYNVKTYGDHSQDYTYPSGGIKTRFLKEKKFMAKNNFHGDELFGMNLFPAGCSKIVTITEGELDALSAHQMLKSNYITPVVSLPSSTTSSKLWEKTRKWLDSFDKIVLSADNDDPGQKVAQVMSEIFPGKVYLMDHGRHKDANDFLMNDDAAAYKSAWWAAKKVTPEGILSSETDYLKLYEESPDFEYFTTGIDQLDSKILGICKGYLTLIQAETGLGKSEFMRYLEWRCLTESKYKIAAMHLEETKLRSVLGLISYDLDENVTLKKFIEDKGLDEEVKKSISKLSLEERYITFSFSIEDGHQALIKQIRYLVAAMGVDYIFFEPIQDCVTGTATEKESKLSDLITQLSTLAAQLGVGIVTIAHQNSEGGAMYSSMITKRAAFELLLTRDRDSDDPTERNRTHIIVGKKNRTGLGNGPAGAVDFDLESFTLKPVAGPVEPKVVRDDF